MSEAFGKLPAEIMELDPQEFAEGLAYLTLQSESIRKAQKAAKKGTS